MKAVFKIIAVLVGILLPIFLFIFLLRIYNGRPTFFGTSDFIVWLENQDFYEPFSNMVKDFTSLNDTYQDWLIDSWQTINNFWDAIVAVVKSLGAILGYISYPVIFLYHIIKTLVTYIGIIFNFIQYVITV